MNERLPWEDDEDPAVNEPTVLEPPIEEMSVPPVAPVEGDVLPPEIEAEERALISVQPQPQQGHHIVTGMAMLARMDDDEFESAMQAIERGQARIREFVQRAMKKGEDYGTVKGIDRPFLHLPGGEKLSLLYGLAVRQEAERVTGNGVEAPPLAYHVKSYVHVGSFDGPIVAMGYGEANSWEEKYRYRWENPKCPNCGREGLIKRKSPPQVAGKFSCPNWKGMDGCGSIFEPNDPAVAGGRQRIENNDPHSLAETLIQMAAKRSFVASIRRATGTSGFFTQDEDSPSVRQQAGDVPEGDGSDEKVEFERVDDFGKVEAGGKTQAISAIQLREVIALSQEKELGHEGMASLLSRLFKVEVEGQRAVSAAVKELTADQAAALINAIQTGEVPEEESESMRKERQFQEEATAES